MCKWKLMQIVSIIIIINNQLTVKVSCLLSMAKLLSFYVTDSKYVECRSGEVNALESFY